MVSEQLRQPLLRNVRFTSDIEAHREVDDLHEVSDHTVGSTYFGTSAQRSHALFILAFLMLIGLRFDSTPDLDCLIEAISMFTIVIAEFQLWRGSHPSMLLEASLYPGNSVTVAGNFFSVNLGTMRLRAGALKLCGVAGLAISRLVSLALNKSLFDLLLLFPGILFLFSSALEFSGEFPDRILRPYNADRINWLQSNGYGNFSRHFGSDMLLSGWLEIATGVSWLLAASVWIDTAANLEISAFGQVLVAAAFLGGSFFKLQEYYTEGSPLDPLLLEISRKAQNSAESPEPAAQVPAQPALPRQDQPRQDQPRQDQQTLNPKPSHPLSSIPHFHDPSAMNVREIVQVALNFVASETNWVDVVGKKGVRISRDGFGYLLKFPGNGSPLISAEIFRTKQFKRSHCGGDPGKYKLEISEKLTDDTFIVTEERGADTPLPACRSTFASTSTVIDGSSVVIVEWSVFDAGWGDRAELARFEPFRVFIASSSGITYFNWLGSLTSWLPVSLVSAELEKTLEFSDDFHNFQTTDNLRAAARVVEEGIWQRVHKDISPLRTGVLLRTSPAYRRLISIFNGLRSKVPEKLPVMPMHVHPKDFAPKDFRELKQEKVVRELVMFALSFSSDLEDWKSTESKEFVSVWRKKLEGEKVDPFKVQVKLKGGDPLTVAKMMASEDFHLKGEPKPQLVERLGENLEIFHSVKPGGTFSKDREFLFANIFREISSTKAVVISIGIESHPKVVIDPRAIHAWKYQVFTFELDGSLDVKVNVAGLVSVGGKSESFSYFVESEVKSVIKSLTGFGKFLDSEEGKKAMNETRAKIVDEAWTEMAGNFKPIEEEFLAKNSEVIAAVTSERTVVVRGSTLSAEGGFPQVGTPSEGGFSAVTSIATTSRKLRTYAASSTGSRPPQ